MPTFAASVLKSRNGSGAATSSNRRRVTVEEVPDADDHTIQPMDLDIDDINTDVPMDTDIRSSSEDRSGSSEDEEAVPIASLWQESATGRSVLASWPEGSAPRKNEDVARHVQDGAHLFSANFDMSPWEELRDDGSDDDGFDGTWEDSEVTTTGTNTFFEVYSGLNYFYTPQGRAI